MKKHYISPQTISHTLAPVLPFAASQFSTGPNQQNIMVSEEEVDEFTSRRQRSVWDNEEEEEESF